MRLVSYRQLERSGAAAEPAWRAGVVLGESVVDAGRAAALLPGGPQVDSVRSVLALDERVADLGEAAAGVDPVGAIGDLRIGPPVPDPEKILCVGLNYRAHAEETALQAPPAPTIFAKFRNCLIGDGDAIRVPAATSEVDYEGELAIVIGRRARRLSRSEALGAVAGAMPFNDVSARDLQMQTPQWTAGKALDTFAPCGPQLVLMDEIADLGDLSVRTRVNGELLQDATTAALIFDVAELVSFISSVMTLQPGDIIATGTPEGVGFTRTPPRFLHPGDQVEVEIGGVGLLRNRVEREQSDER